MMAVDFSSPRCDAIFHLMTLFFISLRDVFFHHVLLSGRLSGDVPRDSPPYAYAQSRSTGAALSVRSSRRSPQTASTSSPPTRVRDSDSGGSSSTSAGLRKPQSAEPPSVSGSSEHLTQLCNVDRTDLAGLCSLDHSRRICWAPLGAAHSHATHLCIANCRGGSDDLIT